MSQIIESVVEDILRQDATNLARQINELVKQQNTNYSWQQDNTLEEFIKALKPHIDELKQCDSNENDWKSDVFFLNSGVNLNFLFIFCLWMQGYCLT